MTTPDRAGRFAVSATDSTRANRQWWDTESEAYLDEHGDFLGGDELVWGPEGWLESELHVLTGASSEGAAADQRTDAAADAQLCGMRVLEFGGGAAQAGRWVRAQGADVVSTDLSHGMMRTGARLNAASRHPVPLIQADAAALPFASEVFDIVFSAFGAVPFISDTAALMRELARVTRPGGIVAFSTTHPLRWSLPDVPDEAGLTIKHSYFDTTPYAEAAGSRVTYTEHHRTMEQRVTELIGAGLILSSLRELPWKESNHQTWGGWSPLRGRLVPGTLVLVGRKPCQR